MDEDYNFEDLVDEEFDEDDGYEEELMDEGDAAEETADEEVNTDVDGGDPEEAEGATDTDVGSNGQTAEESFDPMMQAAINAEAQKKINAFIEREFAGVTNPYTNQPIRTEADLAAYRQAFQMDQQRQQLEDMGVNKEMLDNYIQNHPAMQEAQQVIRQQQQREADAFMENEFKALKKEFPDCGFDSPRALHATEAGRKALQMWAKTPGVTLADAYAATHRAEISKKQSAAVKQAAMNEMNSKGHLKQTKVSGAAGGAEMPVDVLKSYRAFFRDASDDEIRAMWEKNQKY